MSVGQRGKKMAHLLPLGHEIASIGLGGRHLDGHPLDHLEPIALDADDLLRVVGEDAQLLRPQVHEDLRPDTVVAQVGLEAQGLIGFHGVLAVVLDLVGPQLVDEADPTSLLAHVHEDAAAFTLDDRERLVELRAAVAPARAEHVTGEALRVHAYENGLVGAHVALDEGHGEAIVHRGLIGDAGEVAVVGGKLGGRGPPYELLLVDAVLDQVLDGDAQEPVALREGEEIGHPRHPPFVVEHLADHSGGSAPGEAGQVDGGLRMPRPAQDAAGHGAEGKDVARTGEVVRAREGIDEGADGHGAVVGRDSRGDAAPGVHTYREGGAEGCGVVVDHHGDLQLVQAIGEHGHAHEAAALHDHEVYGFWGGFVGGHEEVPFVLAILVVHDDEDPPCADLLHRLLDLRELTPPLGRHDDSSRTLSDRSTYLPITSISRFTRRPGLQLPSVVRSSVCGMTMTSKARSSSAATVRLTPSTATEPLGMSSGARAGSCHSTRMRAVSPSVSYAVTSPMPST